MSLVTLHVDKLSIFIRMCDLVIPIQIQISNCSRAVDLAPFAVRKIRNFCNSWYVKISISIS